jgi:hypothetical protein
MFVLVPHTYLKFKSSVDFILRSIFCPSGRKRGGADSEKLDGNGGGRTDCGDGITSVDGTSEGSAARCGVMFQGSYVRYGWYVKPRCNSRQDRLGRARVGRYDVRERGVL